MSELDRKIDRQIDRLAPRLRRQGTPPPQDLWPAIDRAIASAGPRTRIRRYARLRGMAALAACLLLLAGFGLVGQGPLTPVLQGDVAPGEALVSGRQAVDRAFSDLHAALDAAPDDANLSRLILLLHRSRSRLLRDDVTPESRLPGTPAAGLQR